MKLFLIACLIGLNVGIAGCDEEPIPATSVQLENSQVDSQLKAKRNRMRGSGRRMMVYRGSGRDRAYITVPVESVKPNVFRRLYSYPTRCA